MQSVQGQARVMMVALEKRLGVDIFVEDLLVAWMLECATQLPNRWEMWHHGKTACERNKGKPAHLVGVGVREAVHRTERAVGGALDTFATTWQEGVFLGVKGKTGELIVGTPSGVWKTWTLQRKPLEERRKAENAQLVHGVPIL